MMLKVAPAWDDPGGLFHARENLMLGWIAFALILWLTAAMRTAAGRLAARGAAVPSLDAASPRPAPAIDIDVRRHPETTAPPGRRPDLAWPDFIFGITGPGWSPVRQSMQWRRQAGARGKPDGRKRVTMLRRRCPPTAEPPPPLRLEEGGNRPGTHRSPWTKPLNLLN
jgi:hypothetical protein